MTIGTQTSPANKVGAVPLLSFTAPGVLFAGQASQWVEALADCASDVATVAFLNEVLSQARARIAPVARHLAVAVPGAQERLSALVGGTATTRTAIDSQPAVSIAGITLSQVAIVHQLQGLGLDIHNTRFAGHSQGCLGVAAARALRDDDLQGLVDVVAFALIMGAATSVEARRLGYGATEEAMVSIKGFDRATIDAALAELGGSEVEVALRNAAKHFVLSGRHAHLQQVVAVLEEAAAKENKAVEAKERGGALVSPQFTWLAVAAPFHHSSMSNAVAQTLAWADACGLDVPEAEALARYILVDHHDWTAEINGYPKQCSHLITTDPGGSLWRLTEPLIAGLGVQLVDGATVAAREKLATAGTAVDQAPDWSQFAPRLITLPTGETKVATKFTALTGYSPVLLPGMTPTTVDPDIVAAAANAGYWAEMAGGGQYSEEVFTENREGLVKQLQPGRAAQFNSMFFDRYMWNLQFGAQRIVSKARAAGVAINGVTVSAGIPEVEEATELIASLSGEGFPYICFKPGTVEQIRSCLAIADANPDFPLIIQVEDGHAGGHHSWVNLDDLLLATYGAIRQRDNVVLCVGGGIGTPEKAARWMLGTWAHDHGLPAMPVDGVLIGTATMTAREAKTSPQVKQLLVDTPGVELDDAGGWVGRGAARGGVTSGLSHLHADMYEVYNDSARCSELLASLDTSSQEAVDARREEIIAALNKTAKPYFGDLTTMTYAEVLEKFVALAHPFQDPTWTDRFLDLVHRVEARLHPADHGQIETDFPDVDSVEDGPAVVAALLARYPEAAEITVGARDAKWFVGLMRKHHKPMPWVPAIDTDVARWWGMDSLWQSHDERYAASAVRVIPGPVSVAGITTVDEPVADILGRFEQACVAALAAEHTPPQAVYSRLGNVEDAETFLRTTPHIVWHGHLIDNPAAVLDESAFELIAPDSDEQPWIIRILCDSYWDNLPGDHPYVVQQVDIPVELSADCATGASPLVSHEHLPAAVYQLLAGVAGVGSVSAGGDEITAVPEVHDDPDTVFGVVKDSFTLRAQLFEAHTGVTGAALPGVTTAAGCADALVGPCWPAIYAALGSGKLADGYPVIEGLLNAVHLDHVTDLQVPVATLMDDTVRTIAVEARTRAFDESASGRIVTVDLVLTDTATGEVIATMIERFAIRGRVTSAKQAPLAPSFGNTGATVVDTPRSFIRRTTVTAPADMTPFAMVSGDYNPIHTSSNAAKLVGLQAPLVHGMWLSATAQHFACAADNTDRPAALLGWTYSMYGMVQLNDEVEITVERVGRVGVNPAVEVTCRIAGQVVSRGQAILAAPTTAYVYPGQGIQEAGMGAADRQRSAATREVWQRADAHTRATLGFSIIDVVDNNPTELTVGDTTFRHPAGVLYLTQFTQVALAVVAYGQTARLSAEDALVPGAMYAGHSLGEYTALASTAGIFELEGVIDVVYSRGSAMHSLVPRDEQGRSNYALAALRPNQFGMADAEITDYVAGIAESTGEFLQIVNFNVAGQQYAVAGTLAGLAALREDAEARAAAHGGRRAYIQIPGIDVPFHSAVLRPGVAAFAEKLDALLPAELDVDALVDRYIPNLVARPFALTRDFAESILAVVPATPVETLLATPGEFEQRVAREPGKVARILVIELLAWQFASPVRWIETQNLLIGDDGVDRVVEVGLAKSPTLANLLARTLELPEHRAHQVEVYNVERDEQIIYFLDAKEAPQATLDDAATSPGETAAGEHTAADEVPRVGTDATPIAPAADAAAGDRIDPDSPVAGAAVAGAAPAATPSQPQGAPAAGPAPELKFDAADAICALVAAQNKIRLDQITDQDTTESLTNGVSSRRNQLLMDMAGELGVPTIDGAAEADIATLRGRVVQAAPGYSAFGPVLGELVTSRLRTLAAQAGVKPNRIADRLATTWALPASWTAPVEVEIVLGLRGEESVRGGELATIAAGEPSNATEFDAVIDAAVNNVAAANGTAVQQASAGGAANGGGVVDSAALAAFAEEVTGEEGVLATTARTMLQALGLATTPAVTQAETDTALLQAVEAELGAGWLASVTPVFDATKAVLFDDQWALAREAIARIGAGATTGEALAAVDPSRFAGLGSVAAGQARWWAARCDNTTAATLLGDIADACEDTAAADQLAFADDVALVTGAAPGSIAGSLVAKLLRGGATVVMTASNVGQARKEYARTLFRDHAAGGAKLWLVPANLTSYRDIDALIAWIAQEQKTTVGENTIVTKPALVPTLAFPFAAPSVSGTLADAGGNTETQARLLLWSVERTIAGLADTVANSRSNTRVHIVLPGSPNRGTFGGDGAYGEVKAAFDAMLAKWQAETGWPAFVTLAQARIGWVQGTNLMGGNDAIVPAAKEAGIHVYTPEEITDHLLGLASAQSRAEAAQAPLDADFTGGLADLEVSLSELARTAQAAAAANTSNSSDTAAQVTIAALPNPPRPTQPQPVELGQVTASLDDMIVICGVGEVSSWGSGRTRREAEYGIRRDGTVDLTAAGVMELAWMMGLITWSDETNPGWYNAEGQRVAEEDIYDTYRDEVVARSGIRTFVDDFTLVNQGSIDVESVYLDRDITFTVPTEAAARDYVAADEKTTEIQQTADGEWLVTKRKGAKARIPKRACLTRTVGGQMPTGFDPAKWGIPATMVDGLDRIACWNLVTAVDAYLTQGFSPAELLQAVHPANIASTQGTGIGGMESLHKVFVSRFLGEERPSDILQEALPNVVAAHVMQSFVGGYGSMIHPVAACATAAVSVEEGVDKIKLGKADIVVAGGIDDISVESLTGFGDMNATAKSQDMADKGIDERFYSRANDRRRGGFVEAEGGGTVVLARARVAAELGLPVLAVVAHAQSYADGTHTSIPAPGLGALAAARGGIHSTLAKSLHTLGLTPDDVRVVSKHDTSTNANDPNESELHSLLWQAVGRDEHNPLFVVSQKTLTGHAKGGAALFQIGGLTHILATGELPANAALDCVDPAIEPKATNLVWLRENLNLGAGQVKAGVLTSLGFGHVAAVVVLAHPSCFEQAAANAGVDVDQWRRRATARLQAGARHLEAGMIGARTLYEVPNARRLPEKGAHEAEINLLLNEDARLQDDGVFPAATS
ncbi:type I polyketide synthase [Corynebacterium choanae]|uniref:3-oxoacyl-[acyl-carrier-protein] synthase 2 n=1 Tax=Corynebacterium choanae TaxID=1862358 RepID=A0A3G6JED7_9CORY|nr:type I polyketide synthase [Corynebacterium choanae]AZA14504.1 3-oxoacyl-[acyl-carrier-protein] synthase 2 [Corynebacterium choanae]